MIGLHRHSHFSKRDAIAKIPDIVKRTAQLHQHAWALTDHGTTSGLIDAYSETIKFNHEHGTNIKFIFGVEAYWTPDYLLKDRSRSRHIILLAKNQVGYHNLLKLVTIGYGDKGNQPDNFYYTMRLTTDTIAQHHEGLIVTSACRGGILKDRQYAVERANSFKDIFGDDFYLEIQTATDPDQKDFNLFVLDLSEKLGIKTIVTEDSHYVYQHDADIHRKWIQLDGKNGYYNTDDFYLHSDQQVADALSYIPNINQIIRQTEDVADKCEQVVIPFGEKHFPAVDIPNPKQAVIDIANSFRRVKLKGKSADEKEIYRQRFKDELDVLEQCDYLTYFIINARLVKWCRDNAIQVGRGRGSVCGSLVAFLLDITRVDPIKFGLVFERFANTERISPPDIDTDVPNSKRQQVIDYLKHTYKQVFQVRTFGTTADKAAIQRAAKSLGFDAQAVRNLSSAFNSIDDISNEELKSLSLKFLGIIQQFGVHASALIIFPSETHNFCAIERQGNDYVCAYEFSVLEKMGLLKLDILGMKTLDTVDNTVRLLADRGINVDLDNLPFDDPKTFDMLNSGDTLGCFQIESFGMKKIIKGLHPNNLFDLVPLIALYRPAAIQSGVVDDFIKKSKQKQPRYLFPGCKSLRLKKILKDTFGIPLYQEQAMQIVQAVARYSLGRADVIRRAIGHKDKVTMNKAVYQFIEDGQDNGFEPDTVFAIADWLRNCASYQFNKSHSAAYALLCYQTAYLKANFPVEFFTAYLNSHSDEKQDDLLPIVRYLFNRNINLLPPDASFHSSFWHLNGNSIVTAVNFIKGVGNIHLPISRDNINQLPKNKLLNLIKAGALDFLGSKQQLLDEFVKPDFDSRILAVNKKLDKLNLNADNLFVEPNDSYNKKIAELNAQLHSLQTEYNSLVNSDTVTDQLDVLGFSFLSPFDKFDIDYYDAYDPHSDNTLYILCFVCYFNTSSSGGATVIIETPELKFYSLFISAVDRQSLNVNSFYALQVSRGRIIHVGSNSPRLKK